MSKPADAMVLNQVWKGAKSRRIALLVLVLVTLLLPIFFPNRVVWLAIIALVGIILALGLNFFFGYSGQINFGAAGFYLVGGYTLGLMEKYFQSPFGLNVVAAVFAGALIACLVSLPLLRLRHHMLALGTFAFYLAAYGAVATGFKNLTGGEDGISLAPLTIFGRSAGDSFYYYLLLAMAALCCWVSYTMRHSKVGLAMLALSEDEVLATASGINVNSRIRMALIINGMMAALAGAIFVKWMSWVSPAFFSLLTNVLIVVSVIVGGRGSIIGAVIGGAVVFLVPQFLLGIPHIEPLVFALILTLSIVFLPNGVAGLVSKYKR